MKKRRIEVLVADDDPSMITALGFVLDKENIGYVTASDGREALEVFQKHRPLVVLLDIMMPEIDGYAICRAIKTNPETEDTHVVLVSARGQAADIVRGREAGADGYVTKPFSLIDLVESVKSVTARMKKER